MERLQARLEGESWSCSCCSRPAATPGSLWGDDQFRIGFAPLVRRPLARPLTSEGLGRRCGTVRPRWTSACRWSRRSGMGARHALGRHRARGLLAPRPPRPGATTRHALRASSQAGRDHPVIIDLAFIPAAAGFESPPALASFPPDSTPLRPAVPDRRGALPLAYALARRASTPTC